MNKTLKKIFVFGFPGNYGGAVTEMHHQLLLWLDMGLEVHLIPAWDPAREPLYPSMRERGVIIHAPLDWSVLTPEDAIMGFCSQLFLSYLPDILPYTRRTVSLGCMTWLMDEEKRAMRDGEVALFLFQNEEVRQLLQPRLQTLNPQSRSRFMTFRPYFHEHDFPFHEKRSGESFVCGHISRMDSEKYAAETVAIYQAFSSPLPKKGIFLGYCDQVEEKTGPPPPGSGRPKVMKTSPSQTSTASATSSCNPPTPRKTGPASALRPCPAAASSSWTTAAAGVK